MTELDKIYNEIPDHEMSWKTTALKVGEIASQRFAEWLKKSEWVPMECK